jgi:hypothetical protein
LWSAGIAAFWPELLYFSPHVLADTVAGTLLICGIAVTYRSSPTRLRLVLAGLLLGFTAVIRPQLAPAVAVAALGLAGRPRLDRYIALGASGGAALLAFGLVDWLSWGVPFGSLITYVRVNTAGVADAFGQSGPDFYGIAALGAWRWAALPVLISAAFGVRRAPLIALVALTIVLTFSAVGHKEYRFVYPAMPLLFVLCGIGTADVLARISSRAMPYALTGVWLLAVLSAATTPAMLAYWQRGEGVVAALDYINGDPTACGIALNPATSWAHVGMSRLRDDLVLKDAADPASYDTLLLIDGPRTGIIPTSYSRRVCFNGPEHACVLRRPGSCSTGRTLRNTPAPAVATVLARERSWWR